MRHRAPRCFLWSGAAWIVLLGTCPAAGQQPFRRGDVNADGRVDIGDPSALCGWMFGCDTGSGPAPPCLDAADTNFDRAVDLSDIITILQGLYAGGHLLAPGGTPECSEDPESPLGCAAYDACGTPRPRALDPRFELRLSPPTDLTGPEDTRATFEVDVLLCSADPVRAWSLSIVAHHGTIVAVHRDGTDADGAFDGGSWYAALVAGGAVSGVLLSLTSDASLPASGQGEECAPSSLLRLTIDAPLDSGAPSLEFLDGRLSHGVPVVNLVVPSDCTDAGQPCRPLGVTVPPTYFLRGDCNADSSVRGEVSDAIFLLQFSFQGGKPPPCLVACDANADGAADLSDAVYTLSYNFLGGPPPPGLFPDCEAVELSAALPCETPPEDCN